MTEISESALFVSLQFQSIVSHFSGGSMKGTEALQLQKASAKQRQEWFILITLVCS